MWTCDLIAVAAICQTYIIMCLYMMLTLTGRRNLIVFHYDSGKHLFSFLPIKSASFSNTVWKEQRGRVQDKRGMKSNERVFLFCNYCVYVFIVAFWVSWLRTLKKMRLQKWLLFFCPVYSLLTLHCLCFKRDHLFTAQLVCVLSCASQPTL